jgi:phosphotransferase system HPr (HPr) family protein
MIFEQEAVIHHGSGVHARIAAMIVQRAKELSEKYGTPLYLRSERSERCEMRSLMKLVALKIACGDSVFVAAEGDPTLPRN